MREEFRAKVVASIKKYLSGKDVSQIPQSKAYQEMYPDQVLPGDFEECFREALKPEKKPEPEKSGGDGAPAE